MRGEDRKKFGKGDPRGIIAPESANNSVEAGDLIPTLLFGIPGGAPAALLLGALLVFGVEPGPSIITNDLDIVYTIIWSFALASVLGAALCFVLSIPLARLSFVRFPILAAGLIVVLFTSGFQESKQAAVMQVMLVLGVIGWLMKVTGLPRAPFLIGFVLSIPLERYYFLTTSLHETSEWLTRPWVLVCFGVLVLPLVFGLIRRLRRRGKAVEEDVHAGDDEESSAPRMWSVILSAVTLVMFVAAFVIAQDYSSRARLVPSLVTALGAGLAVAVLVMELRKLRRDGSGLDAEESAVWRQHVVRVVVAFAWLTGFVVLTYMLGILIAAAIFVPLFLLVAARTRVLTAIIYTVVLIGVLGALQYGAGIDIPVGYFTPRGLQ